MGKIHPDPYVIATGQDLLQLKKDVISKIKRGYECIGGGLFANGLVCQSMVLKEVPDIDRSI